MRTKKFLTLTVGQYKLVDKVGYQMSDPTWGDFDKYFPSNIITIATVDAKGRGYNEEEILLIHPSDYKFFRKVVEQSRDIIRVPRKGATFSPSIRVSAGVLTLPFLSVAVADGEYYVVQFAKVVPDGKVFVGKKDVIGKDFSSYKVSRGLGLLMKEAISKYYKSDTNSLIGFSYLVGYCDAKGYKLTQFPFIR